MALLQIVSYPFHDPVLTDRGFISRERGMLRSFVIAGVLGFLAILAFSLVGVHAYLEGMATAGNAPAVVAQGFGVATLFAMTVIMMSSAGSTLDSSFTSLARSPRSAGLSQPSGAERASGDLDHGGLRGAR